MAPAACRAPGKESMNHICDYKTSFMGSKTCEAERKEETSPVSLTLGAQASACRWGGS